MIMFKKMLVVVVGILLTVTLATWAVINWLSAGAGSGVSG